jgi:hypothetical protein
MVTGPLAVLLLPAGSVAVTTALYVPSAKPVGVTLQAPSGPATVVSVWPPTSTRMVLPGSLTPLSVGVVSFVALVLEPVCEPTLKPLAAEGGVVSGARTCACSVGVLTLKVWPLVCGLARGTDTLPSAPATAVASTSPAAPVMVTVLPGVA